MMLGHLRKRPRCEDGRCARRRSGRRNESGFGPCRGICDDGDRVDRFARSGGCASAGPPVTVRGQATVRTEPDVAILWITLSAFEESPGEALGDVAQRAEALGTLLDELGVREA